MFKVGNYVVFKREVCKVKEIKRMNEKDYYVLSPLNDESLTISIPTTTKEMRKLIDKKEVESIIKKINEIPVIEFDNDKLLEYQYKTLFLDGTHESLIKIIKTSYSRNKKRLEDNKKIGDKDEAHFKKAEKLLYTEFSIALNMSYEETKRYVIEKVNGIKK